MKHATLSFQCPKEQNILRFRECRLPNTAGAVCNNEVRATESKCFKAAEVVLLIQRVKDTNKQNMMRAQAVTLGNYRVITAEISARVDINCTPSWCTRLAYHPSLLNTYSILGINKLQLNHTHSMSWSDRQLRYDQTSAVLPIIQRKCFSTVLAFWIPLIKTGRGKWFSVVITLVYHWTASGLRNF
jgi:hypothetical protein